ncbi:hypothetical protein NM208_g3197 [Fusarium decemcellulare]|uniref:Uncharacterized protein n=1 Tax=Fusarium decemcellulare TaxID=57161 RepID=A0ACC1SPT9_9HYPO|nr:hypothetical protein NM208_g3197 [Fusarium decemcellulare]
MFLKELGESMESLDEVEKALEVLDQATLTMELPWDELKSMFEARLNQLNEEHDKSFKQQRLMIKVHELNRALVSEEMYNEAEGLVNAREASAEKAAKEDGMAAAEADAAQEVYSQEIDEPPALDDTEPVEEISDSDEESSDEEISDEEVSGSDE